MADTKRLELRGRTYWYQRAFPTAMRRWLPKPFTGKSNLRVNLKTDSLLKAQQRRSQQDALFDRLIASASASADGEAPEALKDLIFRLQVHYQRHGADEAMELAIEGIEKEQGKQAARNVPGGRSRSELRPRRLSTRGLASRGQHKPKDENGKALDRCSTRQVEAQSQLGTDRQ